MKTKHTLTLDDCHKMLDASGTCEKNNWAVCIAIVDDGGHLLAFSRLDGCAVASVAIAQGKAHSAAIRKRPTKQDEDLIANGRIAALSMPGVTFLEGGVPIVVDGEVIGAAGVSGDEVVRRCRHCAGRNRRAAFVTGMPISCASCSAPMQALPLSNHLGGAVEIDVCWPCHVIWFDNLRVRRCRPDR